MDTRDSNPRRRRRRRRRRRANPIDRQAAIGLGLVGTAIGLAASLASDAVDRRVARTAVASLTGALTGAVIGALLPKDRVGNPIKNPIGTATAVAAGAALALVPIAVAAKVALPKAAGRTAAPTVRGKMGGHVIDVYRNGPTWAWRAPDVMVAVPGEPKVSAAGAGDTRRDAIINAYSELVIDQLEPNDRITLDFYPEQFQVQIIPNEVGAWRWSTTTGESGSADSRGNALTAALDWVDAHSQID